MSGEPKARTYRLVEPVLVSTDLNNAHLWSRELLPPTPGDGWFFLLHSGVLHFDPVELRDAARDNGYDVDSAWTPYYGASIGGVGEDLRVALTFGGAVVLMDRGEIDGRYYSFDMGLQIGWNAYRSIDHSIYPLVAAGFGIVGISAQTDDSSQTPILQGSRVELGNGFDMVGTHLALELGVGAQTVLPLSDDGQGGLALEVQAVYLLQPVASDWRENDGDSPPSVQGPSPTFHGPLLRVGVGWARTAHVQQSREVEVASCTLANVEDTCELRCDEGFLDCDGDPRNGCETSVGGVQHCGSCDNSCDAPHAQTACEAHRCVLSRCEAGFSDCDGVGVNGCERDTRRDALNCGGCGEVCPADDVCQDGRCMPPASAPPVEPQPSEPSGPTGPQSEPGTPT